MSEENLSSTHPQLPPTTEEEQLLWLRLLRSRRVGATTFHRLMHAHGNAGAALAALPEIAREAGVKDYAPCPDHVAEAELRAARAAGARMITIGSHYYPEELRELPDAPPFLWALGKIDLLQKPRIALVGARNASSLGTRMARALAAELGEAGFVCVSGMARGVDTATHLATLKTGTIAVFGGGVDVIYPAENTGLAGEIRAQNGLILSEQPMGLQPQARHFPARNRIISGLARAVVVIEAAAKSGSLITARNALDQGREVLAVPGHPFDARASGCNMLIRDGAKLVRNAEDVIEALGPIAEVLPAEPELPNLPPAEPQKRTLRQTADLHREILNRLGPSPVAEDQLIRDLNAPAARVAPVLVDLELEGRVRRQAGGLLSLRN
jgi:DNA processing protein